MLVHRKKRARYAVQPPLTALIDIVFLLLVYFLLTTNFIVEEGIDITFRSTGLESLARDLSGCKQRMVA